MTTAAARSDELLSLQEIDERTLNAWTAYRDSLRELTGPEYDEAEHRSWERLQRKLRHLEQCRVELASSGEQR